MAATGIQNQIGKPTARPSGIAVAHPTTCVRTIHDNVRRRSDIGSVFATATMLQATMIASITQSSGGEIPVSSPNVRSSFPPRPSSVGGAKRSRRPAAAPTTVLTTNRARHVRMRGMTSTLATTVNSVKIGPAATVTICAPVGTRPVARPAGEYASFAEAKCAHSWPNTATQTVRSPTIPAVIAERVPIGSALRTAAAVTVPRVTTRGKAPGRAEPDR